MRIFEISKRISCICAIASLALLPGMTVADVTSNLGGAIPINDNTYDGTLAGYASGTVNVTGHVSDPNLLITDVEIRVTANHTWVGDLSMFLEAPDGTRVGLLSRPGLEESGDPGECCGFGDNWTNSPETWFQGANIDPETSFTAANLGLMTMWGGTVGSSLDVLFGASDDLAAFNGGVANGIWTLRIADGAALDVGSIGSWQLDIVTEAKGGCDFPVGDVNQDGVVALTDVAPFVALLSGGGFQCEADVNEDGVVSLTDVSPFVALLSGG